MLCKQDRYAEQWSPQCQCSFMGDDFGCMVMWHRVGQTLSGQPRQENVQVSTMLALAVALCRCNLFAFAHMQGRCNRDSGAIP